MLVFHGLAQNSLTIGLKVSGLAFHLKKNQPNAPIYRYKLHQSGRLVAIGGLNATLQFHNARGIGFGIGQALVPLDCAGKKLGASIIGISFDQKFTDKNSVSGIFGPMVFYRESWKNLKSYVDEGIFKTKTNTQYKFVWHGAVGQVNHWYSSNQGVSVQLLPGIPHVLELSGGMVVR